MRPSAIRIALVLLVALTLLLRATGLDHGLPHHIEPDAEIGTQVEYLRGERKGDKMASDIGTYPLLMARLATWLFDAPPHPRSVEPATVDEHLHIASKNYLDARRVGMLLSLLAVPATFLMARRFTPPPWALYAAALVAFSVLGLTFAQQARPHAPAAGLVALGLALALRLRRRGDTSSWILAGLAAGLSVGCLHSGLAVLPAILAAHLCGRRRRLLEPRALIPLFFVAAAVLLLYPISGLGGTQLTGEHAMAVRREGSTLYIANHNVELDRFDGGGVARVLRTLWWYEPALLLLLLVAAGVWLARRRGARRSGGGAVERGDVWVLSAYLVPYLAVLGVYGETFERFVLPALAPLACFAAWGAAELARHGGRIVAASLVLLLGLPVAASGRLAWLHTRPDTLEQAAAWVAERAPDEAVFLSPIPRITFGDSAMELPLLRTREALSGPGGPGVRYYNIWSKYQRRLAPGAALPPLYELSWLKWNARRAGVPQGTSPLEFLAANPRAFFVESGPGVYVVEDHRARPTNETEILLQDALAAFGTQVAHFSPDPPESETGFPFPYQDRDEQGGRWPHVTWRCLRARRSGPIVEVWRVASEDLAD